MTNSNPAMMPIPYDELASTYLGARPRDFNKGRAGHVLVIGGDQGFGGAVWMAAMAAMRVGAGLVTIATHPSQSTVSPTFPEIMCQTVADSKQLQPLLAKANVIILGPGLGQGAWGKEIWQAVIQLDVPMVLDADGLNILATAPRAHANWVLTPHPGEAARLLHIDTTQIQADRPAAAKAIQQQYGGTVVLKGAGSLVATSESITICEAGNPGMATAGMGDILSGVIGGFIGQGIPLAKAAALGVAIHARAGDIAAKSGERGIVATDLLTFLHELCNNHR